MSLVETLGVRDADVVESMGVPFTAWIEITHPEGVDLLDDVESAEMDSPAFDRSLRLWEQRSREYADAVLAGEVE